MSVSVNKATLIGNLGKDPELKYTSAGKAVASFSLATSFGIGDNEKTTWHNVVAWEKNAENLVKYVGKGNSVYVEGRIENRKYEDKEGVTRYVSEVVAENIKFLSFKADAGEAPKPTAKGGRGQSKQAQLPDDPF